MNSHQHPVDDLDNLPACRQLGSRRLRWLQLAGDLQALAGDDIPKELADDATRKAAILLARELAALGLALPLTPEQVLSGEWAAEPRAAKNPV